MRHKITLLTAAVVLAFLACVTPRAFGQTFEATHASGLILAGNGTDPVHTLTISVASLGGASTLTLPGGNTAGVLTNPGNGLLTWSPLGIANIAPGTANQFLVTNNAGTPAVQWIGLNINSTDLTGNGIGTALDIASTYPGGTSITTLGTIATGTWAGMTIAVNHGGTGAVTLTSGDLLLGNGTSPVTAGPAWSAGTLTGNVSGSALSFTGNLVGDVTGTQGATKINNTSAAGADVIAALTANTGTLTNSTSGSAASFTGSLVGDVTGTQGATKINNTSAAGADVIAALTANAGTLTNNTSGSAASFTGSLVGDVTGTQGATKINNTSAAGADVIAALTANTGTLTNNTSGNATTSTTATKIVTTNQTTGTYVPAMVASSTSSTSTSADVAAGLSFTASATVPSLMVGTANSSTGSIVLANVGNTNLTTITVPSGAPAITYTLPSSAPGAGTFLEANTTTGGLTWGTPASTGVTSVGNAASDNSLTIAGTGSGPYTGAVTTKLNLANPNTWTGQQTFSNTTSAAAPLVVTNSDAPATGPAIGATISAAGVGSGTNGNIALELNATGSTISNAALYVQTGTVNIAGLSTNSPVFTDGSRNLTSTGTVGVASGGTGVPSPTAHDLLVAEGGSAMTPVSGAAGTVLIGNGSSADPSFSATPTLGVAGTTAGTLTLASGAAAFSTTVQTSATTPASTYIYQLPAQPTGLPTAGNVLTIGTPTGTGPYTVPLSWSAPNSTTGVLYDQTTEQATVPISSTPATPSFLFNVGYNNTVVADSAAGAIINSINTNTTAANAPLHNADGFTVNVTATGSGTFYGNATGLIVNATAPVGGIPTGVAVTINGDSIGPAFQLHNKTPGSFYGARSIISTVDSDLEFKETGDKYGTSILDIQNRTGSNGALFQTISNAADTGTDVIDWGFIPGNGTQSNIRLEARHKWAVTPYTSNEYLRSSANITSASPEEFQYFFGTTGATPLYTLSIGENATLLERGNFGIGYGTNSPGGDTAQGSPRVRLDVHSPGSYYGNLSDVGYSGASNILLSDTGTSSITAPFVGAMEFQGTNDGISSFAAGAEASRYINYTWPTLSTAPTANQVLSISTISGSGTLATPYLAQLTWATASGSSTGVNYNVATGSPQNTATTTNDLFNVAYTAASGTSATLPGAVITANASGATTTGVATGLSITTTGKGTSGTATGLNLTTTGASTASNNIDISGTNNNWTISALGEITFGTAGTSSAPNITSTAGTAMYVQAGTSTTTNAAGPAVTLQAGTGNGTGIGGGLELWGGTPGATSGNAAGGFASLDGANSADGIGGADSVNAGNGGTSGAGGTVYVAAGNGAGVGVGGAVLVTGGIGGSTGAGGAATIQAGTGGTTGAGGLTTIEGGNGAGTSQAAGGLTLNGGRSTGTASGSTITFQAAPAGGTSNPTLNALIAAATMSATSTTAAQLEIGNTNGGASGISGSLILANTGHQDSTIIQPSATTPALNYTYQLPAQTVAAQPSSGYVLTAGTPTGTSPNYTIPLSWSPVSGSSTGVNFNVTTAQTAAIAANNYLFNVGYTSASVDDSAVGAVITSTNTSTNNGGSATSHSATGLTVNATATSQGSQHGNSTAIFANATAGTSGTATGLNFNVVGGTDVDILGTAGWSVSSAGAATFAGITDAGTTTINNTGTATTQIGNVGGFGAVTIGSTTAAAGTSGSVSINSGSSSTAGDPAGTIAMNTGAGVAASGGTAATAGGALSVTLGVGGVSSSSSGGTAAAGGGATITAGIGGAATASHNAGAQGGGITLTAGTGGANATSEAAGAGGGISLTAGAAGSASTGTGAGGGNITLTPGAATGTGAVGSIVAAGHVVATGTVPSVGNTGATIQTNSSDFAGLVTSTGTGATTSQTVTFANAFANAPYVMVVAENATAAKSFSTFNTGFYVTSTTTGFTVTYTSMTAGSYYYMVVGNQ